MHTCVCYRDDESSDESETEMEIEGSFGSAAKGKHDLMIKAEVSVLLFVTPETKKGHFVAQLYGGALERIPKASMAS